MVSYDQAVPSRDDELVVELCDAFLNQGRSGNAVFCSLAKTAISSRSAIRDSLTHIVTATLSPRLSQPHSHFMVLLIGVHPFHFRAAALVLPSVCGLRSVFLISRTVQQLLCTCQSLCHYPLSHLSGSHLRSSRL